MPVQPAGFHQHPGGRLGHRWLHHRRPVLRERPIPVGGHRGALRCGGPAARSDRVPYRDGL